MEKVVLYTVLGIVLVTISALIYNNYNNTVLLEQKANELSTRIDELN